LFFYTQCQNCSIRFTHMNTALAQLTGAKVMSYTSVHLSSVPGQSIFSLSSSSIQSLCYCGLVIFIIFHSFYTLSPLVPLLQSFNFQHRSVTQCPPVIVRSPWVLTWVTFNGKHFPIWSV
jgi:hypothetical protein